jgi:hypothetical protein
MQCRANALRRNTNRKVTQRTAVSSVILLWLGQFVWRQGQCILHNQLAGSVRAGSPKHSVSHNYICSLARRSLRRPSQVVIQRRLVGEINAVPTSGQKQFIPTNSKQYKTAVLKISFLRPPQQTDTVDAGTNRTRWIPFTETFVCVLLCKV